MEATSTKTRLLARWSALSTERSSWIDHWRDLSEHIRPRGSRFLATDRNKGWKVNRSIVNTHPTFAARTLAAGMMSGITSPSRPWFKLQTPDSELNESASVKAWLVAVEDEIRSTFHRSNFYDSLHVVYSDLCVFGTSVLHIDEDPDKLIRCYVHPVGQYALAVDPRGVVDTVFREVSLTVRQAVEKFTLEACSSQVQNLHKERQLDSWVECLHAIEPNTDYREGALGSKGKRFASCWMEKGGDSEKLLQESGYDEFPVMAPRWAVTGEDVYGSSPAMDALGDCRALQHLEKRKAMLADKLANPPMNQPPGMAGASLLPGALNRVMGGERFEPSYLPNPAAFAAVSEEIRRHEERIDRAFYADLWLMLQRSEGTMTAREVSERREEKLLQLGTVLQRVSIDLLDPAVERTFHVLERAGRLPKPPEELQGKELRVEYLNIMAQAQKLLGVTSMERLTTFGLSVGQQVPAILDKLDLDQTVDEYAAALGVPPTTVRPDDQVLRIRSARAKAQMEQAQMEQAAQAAQAAKSLGQTPLNTESPTALTEMLRGLGAR